MWVGENSSGWVIEKGETGDTAMTDATVFVVTCDTAENASFLQ
jgi:hypothetical protein